MYELQILTIVFMIVSFASVWSSIKFNEIPLWVIPFGITIILGVFSGALSPLSLVWIGIAIFGFYSVKKWPKYSTWILIPLGFFILVLGMNLLPGFNKIQLISPRLLGNSTHQFYLDFKLAKPITGLLLLAFIAQKCASLKEFFNSITLVQKWAFPTLVVLGVGMALGLAVDVKFFIWTPVFIVCNVFFTVIPEEAFFRGLLQQPLQNRFGKTLWIIPLMAVLFALVHIPPTHIDPIKFYAVIGLAGACYAWAYRIRDRIELSIASHTLLNTIHFIFLTYPLAL